MESSKSNTRISAFTLVTLMATLFALAFSACVSVNIGPKPGEKSKGVEFNQPEAPYVAMSETHADGAWQNKENGASISYFSTCNDQSDPSIDTVSRELFAGITDMKILNELHPTFNDREALDTEVEGKVDGIVTRIRALVFKKNGCTYTLSHIGVPKAFQADRSKFKDFVGSFHAP